MLSLSSKYALNALIFLAKSPENEFIRVDVISRKTKVPGPYLSKVLKELARKKVIESRRGAQGGVRLNRKIKPLSFYEVCVALKDPLVNQRCILSKGGCNSNSPCLHHQEWSRSRENLKQFLKTAKIFG